MCPGQFSFRRYEIFLSSTPEVTSHLLITDIRCSGGSEVGTFESGAKVTGLSFVEDTVATANGAVTVESASGTFTVFNQVGASQDVPFALSWMGDGPAHKISDLTDGSLLGIPGNVLVRARLTYTLSQVTGTMDGSAVDSCCWPISTVP